MRTRWSVHAAISSLSVLLLVAALPARAQLAPQLPLKANSIPKFVDPLPALETIVDDGVTPIELHAREFKAQVLPAIYPPTTVWGYLTRDPGTGQVPAGRASYIGPVIVATRGTPTTVKLVNDLGTATSTGIRAYRDSTDQMIHWADPLAWANPALPVNECHSLVMPPAPATRCALNYTGPIPLALHLHGGEVPPELDGGPDAWVTSDGAIRGPAFYSQDGNVSANHLIYRYPNSQESAPIWFHDHALGITRLSVFAGLAGAYVIQDPNIDRSNLPPLVPLVIQDRMFDTTGELFFTAGLNGGVLWALNPDHPYWNPEFVGDVVVVNGKSWPYLNVERKRYTFFVLNGSNARTYELSLAIPGSGSPSPNLWVIGTDGGYLDAPQATKKLVVMPGERYQVIVDFSSVPAGKNLTLRNTAKTPYPGGAAPAASTVGEVMEFRVVGPAVADATFNPATPGAVLRGTTPANPAIQRLANPLTGTLAVTPTRYRQLTLNEVLGPPQFAVNPIDGVLTQYPGGPMEILLNNTMWGGRRNVGVLVDPTTGVATYDQQPRPEFATIVNGSYASETPAEGETEVWEIVNLTADAHPIHLHLVQFQLLNRQNFDTKTYGAAYAAAFPGGGIDPMTLAPYPAGVFSPGYGPPLDYFTGNPRALGGNPDIAKLDARGKPLYLQNTPQPPLPHEAGWKDTVVVPPGQVTRLVVRWTPTDRSAFPFNPASNEEGYVWHCHILDHEDNEMMRPTKVAPVAGAVRTYVRGVNY